MVEQIRISPEEVRGYGNVCEEHSLEDFIVSSSALAKEKETVHGALTDVYKLVYSLYGLMFDFDNGNKQLYLQMGESDILSFGFDDDSKQLYLLDMAGTGLSLGFDEDTNELYITDDAPPIVHNYTLALDSESYTTTGSLSVSATLLDNGVAVSGATISFTGGTSTVTATTDSNGIATATVTFNSSGTLTASYSNVSDTATVTVQTYLFYDACSTDNTSQYSECYDYWELTSNPTFNITFDTDHYVISHSTGDFMGVCLPNLTTSVDNYVFTADVLATGTHTDYGAGLGMVKKQNVGTGQGMVQPNSASSNHKHTYLHNVNNRGGSVVSQVVTTGYVVGDYHTHRLTKQGTSILYEILHNGTVIFSKSNTCDNAIATGTVPCLCIGRWETGAKFKNIKVESL